MHFRAWTYEIEYTNSPKSDIAHTQRKAHQPRKKTCFILQGSLFTIYSYCCRRMSSRFGLRLTGSGSKLYRKNRFWSEPFCNKGQDQKKKKSPDPARCGTVTPGPLIPTASPMLLDTVCWLLSGRAVDPGAQIRPDSDLTIVHYPDST